MKRLNNFQNNKLNSAEAFNIKGGIRFITTDKDAYKAKTKELKALDIHLTGKEKFECPITGVKTYCIEW